MDKLIGHMLFQRLGVFGEKNIELFNEKWISIW